MSKLYLVAIKWDKAILDNDDNYRYVITTKANYGDDIAGFTENYTYKDGWRIYTMTTKKAQQGMVDSVLHKNKQY